MRRIVLAVSFFVLLSACPAEAATTPTLSFPPIDIGIGPTGWNWSYFNGAKSGFSLSASSSFSFNRLTMWECVNNGVQVVYAHVYKGELDHLEEIATSSPFTFTNSCPPDINQRTYLLSTDGYKDTYVFDQQIPVTSGERITILFEPIVGYPYGGYIQFGARPARDITDFVGRVGTSSVTTSPTDINPLYPYYPAFELGNETAECTPGMAGCNSNVLFLPGMMGSRLYDDVGYQAWLPAYAGDALLRLPVNADGTSAYAISTGDAIDEAYGTFNIYHSFIAQMNDLRTQGVIHAWAAAPYDWRLDYETLLTNGRMLPNGRVSYTIPPEAGHDPYIIETLKQLALSSPTGKVTIIAHSNGGLLTKALTNKLGLEASQLIDKIIFVDVPQLGTPKAIGGLLHGTRMGIPESFPLVFGETEARALAQNMPLTYNLLPSSEYFHYVDDSVLNIDAATLPEWAVKYGTTTHSTERLGNFLLDTVRTKPAPSDIETPEIGNPTLFTRAKAVHDTLDHWTPPTGVQLTTIAGWGEETLSGIAYRNVFAARCTGVNVNDCIYYKTLTFNPKKVIDGDGTVVETSALWANGASAMRYWVNLPDYNTHHPIEATLFGRSHADVLEVPALRTLIKNIITGTSTQLQYITSVAPQYTGDKPRLHFTLHSPLTLEFYDTLGNHVGYSTSTGNIDLNIPGVDYERYGDVQWLSVPKELAGQLVMHGTGSGSFTLDAEEVNGNNTISTTSFEGIPSSTSTIVTMNINPAQSVTGSSTLVVDENGDGHADITLKANQNSTVFLEKPALTVTADNKTITLGSSLPLFTATLSGFINSDTASTSITGRATCTTTSASSVGIYPITCTIGTLASSKYDFTKFATGTLTILYRFDGFLQPINDTTYNPTQSLSVFKGGSTVPVKFQLKTATSTPVQSKVLPLWLTPQKGASMSAAVDESSYSDPATSGTAFKWDSASQQYIYNWSTKGLLSGYWYRISAQLDDGTTRSVVVGVR